MQVIDASDPVNLVEIGQWNNRYIHDVCVDGNVAMVCLINHDRFRLIDVSDSTNPVNLGSRTGLGVEAGVDDVTLYDAGEGVGTPEPAAVPSRRIRLGTGFPNPFREVTTLELSLPARARTELAVFDVHGRLVTKLVDDVLEPGPHVAQWDGRSPAGRPVAAGVYFVRLKSGAETRSRKVVRLQ